MLANAGRHQGRRSRDPRHRRHLRADRSAVQRARLFRSRRSARATTRRWRRPTCARWRATAKRPRATAGRPICTTPSSRPRLHRIRIPTLFLWGTGDRIVSEAYGRAYCAAIPGARFETDRARRPFSASRAAGGIRPAASSPSCEGQQQTMRVYHFTEHPYPPPGTIRRPICASTCRTGDRSRRSRPISFIAITTNGCSPTSSASTSCSTSIIRPRPACRRPRWSASRCWRGRPSARASWCSAIRSATGPIRCASPRSSPPST